MFRSFDTSINICGGELMKQYLQHHCAVKGHSTFAFLFGFFLGGIWINWISGGLRTFFENLRVCVDFNWLPIQFFSLLNGCQKVSKFNKFPIDTNRIHLPSNFDINFPLIFPIQSYRYTNQMKLMEMAIVIMVKSN